MKKNFWSLVVLLVLSRILDFYTTSLWFFQPDGIKGEMNPLTRFFGLGWTGLVVTNILLIGLIIWSYYYHVFKYEPVKLEHPPNDFKTFVSRLYYGNDHSFYKICYSTPKNRRLGLSHFGYVVIRVVIFGSILASIHNLCQFYNVEAYNIFRSIVKRPLYVIYGLIILSFFYFQYEILRKEYQNRSEK